MANRQALRELQTRLADRLSIARKQGVAASWLAVETSSKKYLLPLTQSGEIFPWVSIQSVPYTQNWFVGVANLRGGLFGVVDLASFVSGQHPRTKNDLEKSDSRLVVLNTALDVNCALMIDKLSGLRNQMAFKDFTDKSADSPAYFGHSYIDMNNSVWQEINLQTLAQQAQFLTIST